MSVSFHFTFNEDDGKIDRYYVAAYYPNHQFQEPIVNFIVETKEKDEGMLAKKIIEIETKHRTPELKYEVFILPRTVHYL